MKALAQTLGAAALLAACVAAQAQPAPATPSVDEMIEKLQRSAPAGGSRTRSFRGLVAPGMPSSNTADPAPGPATGAAPGPVANGVAQASAEPKPSLSLQIQFDFDSANVRPESRLALERLARAIGSPQLAGARFAIEGHTDAKGRADYNLQLSDRRAARVKEVLAGLGVDPTRLLAVGKGSTEPADPSDPNAAANRRVRVVNLD